MKLSAPLPPPPPPEQPEPGQPVPEAIDSPRAELPVPPAPKPLTWPSWFAGADVLLAALAVVLAFMVASFVARNTDIWLHLAAGKRLVAGEYTPGTDPFSYSGADRVWVNHNLLFDLGAYLLFRGDGMLLGVVKALAVAAAFGLLIGIRRPGHALWPWAAVAVVAIIAAGPRLTLSPLVGSVFLLATTLFLLFRMPHRPNSWRFPIAIGITFWLWAGIDSWFFLGPLTLALVLAGELVQRQLLPKSEPASGGEAEPLGALPEIPVLAWALAIGIVACMLTPHHVRIWELPFELTGGAGVKDDFRIRQLMFGPLDEDYSAASPKGRSLGYNISGLAYVVLFVGGGLALGFGASRVRIAHVALWVGFALLSLTSIYAIPFLAIVAVPIIASQLNGLSERAKLRSWGDPRSRFLLLGSAAGRVTCLIMVLVACAFAWPGWLHIEAANPAFARRVAWGIQPDEGLVKAAEQLKEWRESGKLPEDARGMIASPDMANYCAWFAPREKVYVNGRFNFHRPELKTFMAIRKGLAPIEVTDAALADEQHLKRTEESLMKDLDENLKSLGVEYVVVSGGAGEGSPRVDAQKTALRLWLDNKRWSVWYLDGRSTVCGWRVPGAERPSFAALHLDPIVLALGRRVERVPPGSVKAVPKEAGWEDAYVRSPKITPAAADEALGWARYAQVRQYGRQGRQAALELTIFLTDRLIGHHGLMEMRRVRVPAGDDDAAVALLGVRAARRAIEADPDHPDGYYALATALLDSNLPLQTDERTLSRVTALRQYLARLPAPDRYRPGVYACPPSQAAIELAFLYLNPSSTGIFWGIPVSQPGFQILTISGPGAPALYGATGYMAESGRQVFRIQPGSPRNPPNARLLQNTPYLLPLDLVRDTIALAQQYAPVDSTNPADAKRNLEELGQRLKLIDEQVAAAKNSFARVKLERGGGKVSDQLSEALRFNLVGEALRLLTDKDTDLPKEFGRNVMDVALLRVALELAVGRLEEASADIEVLSQQLNEAAATPEARRDPKVDAMRQVLNDLIYQKLFLEGNYAEAGAMREKAMPPTVGTDPPFAPESAAFKPAGLTDKPEALGALFNLLPLSVSVIDVPSRLGAFGQVVLAETFLATQRNLNARREFDAEFFWRRGFLFLLEGNIGEAKKRFQKSFQPGRKEWGVPDRRHADAERYLRMIELAEKNEK